MGWQATGYALGALVAAGFSGVVAVQAWRHREERAARPFTALMVALAGWSLASGVQLGFTTPAGHLLWRRVGLAIGGTIPTVWVLFTIQYSGHEAWLTPRRTALLAVEPFLFGTATLTNPYHGLVWSAVTFTSGPVPLATLTFGAGYYLHITYAYLFVAGGLGLLAVVFARASPIYRRQTGLLILGTLPPLVANVAYTLRLSWGPLPAVDPTPFGFIVTGVLFGLALFEFDLLQRTPIARRRVLKEMGDGLVVLDAEGTVVDVNPVARTVLDPEPTVGRPIADLGPDVTDTAEATLDAIDGTTVEATVRGRQRAYDVQWSPLIDYRDETVGHALALRDVTDRNEYEQRLEVAQRVLRHNLRNDVSVIQAQAEQLREAARNGQATAAQQIIDTASGLIDLSEKTRRMVRMEETAGTDWTDVDVRERLSALVDGFRTEYPDATVECELPVNVEVTLPDERFLEVPVRNLVENAIEHNDADDPWVRLRAEPTGGHLIIRVEDDGPPIPEMERAVLQRGTEQPLEHGSGVGLWLAYWSVTTVGGTVSFADREPRGNVVTLEVPLAERSAVASTGGETA